MACGVQLLPHRAELGRDALCVPRIASTALTSTVALPGGQPVMITDHVPAVRLPPDHAGRRVATAVPACGCVEDRRDPDPAPVGAGNAVISCDLGILVEEAAESIASLNAGAGIGGRGRVWLLSSGDEVLARSWPTARRSTVLAAQASRAARKKPASPRTRGARHWEPTDKTGLRGTRRHRVAAAVPA